MKNLDRIFLPSPTPAPRIPSVSRLARLSQRQEPFFPGGRPPRLDGGEKGEQKEQLSQKGEEGSGAGPVRGGAWRGRGSAPGGSASSFPEGWGLGRWLRAGAVEFSRGRDLKGKKTPPCHEWLLTGVSELN